LLIIKTEFSAFSMVQLNIIYCAKGFKGSEHIW